MELSYANFDTEESEMRGEDEFKELVEGEKRIDLGRFDRERQKKNEPQAEEPIETGNLELLAEQSSETLGSDEHATEEEVNVIQELRWSDTRSPHLEETKKNLLQLAMLSRRESEWSTSISVLLEILQFGKTSPLEIREL